MNELLKWGAFAGIAYLAYNWFVNSQAGHVAPRPGSMDTGRIPTPTGSGGTPPKPDPNMQTCASGTVMTSSGCQAPPSFAGIPGFSPGGMPGAMGTGMGRYNYVRRGTPMRRR